MIWLFGKLEWNVIRTTFRDLFSFSYFVYLLFRVVWIDYVNNFSFIEWIMLLFFVLSIIQDAMRELRYALEMIKVKKVNIGDEIIRKYDKLRNFLFVEQIEDTTEILLASFLIELIYIQLNKKNSYFRKDYNLPHPDYKLS